MGNPGSTRPPRAPSPQQSKNMKRRERDARSQAGRSVRRGDGTDQNPATAPSPSPLQGIPAGRQAGQANLSHIPCGDSVRPARAGRRGLRRVAQRERERERRVSDADASYKGPSSDTRTPKHVIPQRNHAKNNSLSKTTRSLSQGPRQNSWWSTTKTDPNPTLCSPAHPMARGHRLLIHEVAAVVNCRSGTNVDQAVGAGRYGPCAASRSSKSARSRVRPAARFIARSSSSPRAAPAKRTSR
jgi:hypothetical protein